MNTYEHSVFLDVVTKLGYFYNFAEEGIWVVWHGVGDFDFELGRQFETN